MPKYADAKNAQILIALLKAHNINQIVVNPGTTNISFVGSVQNDPFFKVFSGVDERHSAYLACGLAAESGKPVVLSCTGATASRNYFSALTEAYYRKLPILAVTSSHEFRLVGHLSPQFMDRSVQPKDTVKISVQCPTIHSNQDARTCEININKAILELTRNGGGPAHINLEASVNSFNTNQLPEIIPIHRYGLYSKNLPEILPNTKIVIWIGSHTTFSKELTQIITKFAETYQTIILTDRTSGYYGKYCINGALIASQDGIIKYQNEYADLKPDLIIHIGEISGDYPAHRLLRNVAPVWRVNPDGELRDTLGKLTNVFEMPERKFFEYYIKGKEEQKNLFFSEWEKVDNSVREKIPELPFSNPWIARQLNGKLPENSVLHLGILNTLRSWNYYQSQQGITSACNVGGFGIDGILSTIIGASLVSKDKLYFCVVGDLAFFYDLNSLGNRYIDKNLRILLINNGCGGEFNMYNHPGSQFGKDTNLFIAAGGHFGNKSPELVKHFAQDLGFKYLTASTKEEFIKVLPEFVSKQKEEAIIFECFTNTTDESNALKLLNTIIPDNSLEAKVKKVVPTSVKNLIKKVIQ